MNHYLQKNIPKDLAFVFSKIANKLHEPFLGIEEIKLLTKCVKNNSVSTIGREVGVFEKKFSKFVNSKYSISTNSGTSGLHLSLLALGINSSHEVLVPSLTFVASLNSILYCNSTPHFIEVQDSDLNIDFEKLDSYLSKIAFISNKKCINKKTGKIIKCIMPVHLYGNMVNLDKLDKLKKKYFLKVVEDATEALGSKFKNINAGTFGDAGVFSFNGNKIITTGAGGMVVTNNYKIAKKIKHFSMQSKITKDFNVIHDSLGFNYRMPALNASMGLAQLNKISKILRAKKKINSIYGSYFKKDFRFELIKPEKNCYPNFWFNTISIKNYKPKDTYKLMKFLRKRGIQVRALWYPLHLMKIYKRYPRMNLSITKKVWKNHINIPSSPTEKFYA